MRRKHQLTRNRVQFQNRLECLLEEAHIKLSSLVSDLLGKSARYMLQAVAEGETNPETIAALADHRLRATAPQLRDALGACRDLHPVYRQLLKMALEELKLMEEQIDKLEQEMASLLSAQQDVVQRLAEVPGLGVDSAQQSWTGGRSISLGQTSCFVGGCLSWGRRKCRHQLQPPLTQGQQADEGASESGVERGSQNQRQYL